MRLYLDLCCFNRPFDDQGQLLVRLQTEAKLAVQESIRNGTHALIWSAILDLENADNPDSERKTAIGEWKRLAEADVATTSAVEQLACALAGNGLKPMDALHIASAIEAGAGCFLTTDKQILRKMKNNTQIQILDPVDFIRETEAADE
jgi:predicted nucleic acid-binding protein